MTFLPVVQNLWDLASDDVGPIGALDTGVECEHCPVRAAHLGNATISMHRPLAVVLQQNCILLTFLGSLNALSKQDGTHTHTPSAISQKAIKAAENDCLYYSDAMLTHSGNPFC